jgi:hypothetical protein
MRPCLCLVALLVTCVPVARAEEPRQLFDGCRWAFPKLCEQWHQRCCWCPDDYCAKPLPCVPPNAKGCVDDYCRKPLPCVPPNAKGCVDDYCPRTCPLFLGRLCEPWYTCGPPCGGTSRP